MVKKILAALFTVFVLVSVVVILYWRDVGYEPGQRDLILYFVGLPLIITGILLSPWLIYRAYRAQQERKAQAELARQSGQEETVVQLPQQTEWLKLNIYTAHAYSALGEDQAILEGIKNYSSPELDQQLQNGYGLPILSYRIQALDDELESQDEENEFISVRQQRIMALIRQQLEQQIDVLIPIAEHLKRSDLFYDSPQAYEYRMHPAWTDPNADPAAEAELNQPLRQVRRLDRLNMHILLSEDLQHIWDEQTHREQVQHFLDEIGIIAHNVHLEYHFLGAQGAMHDLRHLLQQLEDKTQEVTFIFSADSEIDQDVIDERTWISDHYIPAEFVSSCCLAAPVVEIEQLEPLKMLQIALNRPQLKPVLDELELHELPQYDSDEPFAVVTEDAADIKMVKKLGQYFAHSPVEPQHYFYCKSSVGHTQHLAQPYGLMLGMLPEQPLALVFTQDVQVLIQAIAEPVEAQQMLAS